MFVGASADRFFDSNAILVRTSLQVLPKAMVVPLCRSAARDSGLSNPERLTSGSSTK